MTAKVRVGCQPSWHHAALFIILEKGWVQKALGVELDVRVFATGPEEMEAFAAGALDVAYVGATPPLSIIAKGARAKIVAVANTEGSSIVVRPDLMYEGPQSLIGKTIGCYPPGSIQHTLLTRWLRGNGVDPDREVTMRFQGPAEQLESLRAKAIDAALVPDPHPYVAVVRGYGKMAVNSSEMWPHHPCCVVLMSEDFITRNREVAVRLVALHVIASEYATRPKRKSCLVVLTSFFGLTGALVFAMMIVYLVVSLNIFDTNYVALSLIFAGLALLPAAALVKIRERRPVAVQVLLLTARPSRLRSRQCLVKDKCA